RSAATSPIRALTPAKASARGESVGVRGWMCSAASVGPSDGATGTAPRADPGPAAAGADDSAMRLHRAARILEEQGRAFVRTEGVRQAPERSAQHAELRRWQLAQYLDQARLIRLRRALQELLPLLAEREH